MTKSLLMLSCLLQLWLLPPGIAAELTADQEKQLFSRAALYARQPHQMLTARKMFLELVTARPQNTLYFKMYADLLLQLGDFETAGSETRGFLDRLPQNEAHLADRIELLALLSEISYRSGDEVQSEVFQQEARHLARTNVRLLEPLLASLARLKQEDKLLAVITQERRQRNNPDLWIIQAGDSYLRQEKWLDAFQEYQRGFTGSGTAVSTLRQRIVALPLAGELLQSAVNWGESNTDSVPITRTLGQWLVRQRQFERAVPFYLQLDRLTGSEGESILHLGQLLVKEQAWRLALSLLQEHLHDHPHHPRSYERAIMIALCQRADGEAATAVATLSALLSETSDRNQLSSLQIQIGDIMVDDLQDPVAALSWYEQVDGPGNWLSTAYQKRVKTHLIMGALEAAQDLNLAALNRFRYDQQIRYQLLFQQASLYYYAADFERCRGLLDSLAANNFSQATYNDIIRQIRLLSDGGTDEVLIRLASAELAILQHRPQEASPVLLQLLHDSADGTVLLRVTELLTTAPLMRDYISTDRLEAALSDIATRLPELIQLDEILYRRDQLLAVALEQPAAALPGWEQFLVDYPRSPRVDEVRARVRRFEQRSNREEVE
ncbi:MAG: hypothetical protein ISR91_07575 [Candidatus Delongbacteria bacterium]|nr:hypothetical protein [Candidatus Delongbacteria bacterium]